MAKLNKLTRTILEHGHVPTAPMRVNKTTTYITCRYCDASATLTSDNASGTLLTTICNDSTSNMLAKHYLKG